MSAHSLIAQDQSDTLVPLSLARHGTKRWRRLSDYSFAGTRRTVPIVLAEAEIAATALPLAFARDTAGMLMPVALLRLNAAQSPFVGAQGQWQAPYIPAHLRVHPFDARAAEPDQPDSRMVLLVDESTGHVTDDALHERFFDPFGAPAPALEQVVAFFKHYQANMRDTRAAMQALTPLRSPAGEGLFVPLTAPDATQISGLWAVARDRFAALPDASVGALRDTGALGLVMAHLISLNTLTYLDRAEQAMGRTTSAAPEQMQAMTAPDVSDFLSALATSQDRDTFNTSGGTNTPITG